MGNENIDLVEQVEQAFQNATTAPVVLHVTPGNYKTPDEYILATGKRFRMTKDEMATYGNPKTDSEARQKAFDARLAAGTI